MDEVEDIIMSKDEITYALFEFAKYIKRTYTLGNYYGSMFSNEFCECDPPAALLVTNFIKDTIKDSDA